MSNTSEDLSALVISIMRVLSVDYPQQWKKDYPSQDDKKQLKRRLLQLLASFPQECIVNGYENCIAKHPDYMPTIPSIMAYIADEHAKHRQKLKNQEEVKQLENRPAPKKTMTSNDLLRFMSEALQVSSGNETDRLKRLKEASENNKELVREHTKKGLIRTSIMTGVLCAKCGRPGVLSNGITGNGNFYCSVHFINN